MGVPSEMELAFAGLHQLCAPMLDHVDHLPVPQRDALRTAFGLAAGPLPDFDAADGITPSAPAWMDEHEPAGIGR